MTDIPTPVNTHSQRHRLARSANGPGGNHRNHDPGGGQRHRPPAVKATHVEVDPASWRELRAQAIRWRLPMREVISRLVLSAVIGGIPIEAAVPATATTATTPEKRPSDQGRRARHFTRLPGIDDLTWEDFKVEAAEAGVTIARAIGIVVEYAAAEAKRHKGS